MRKLVFSLVLFTFARAAGAQSLDSTQQPTVRNADWRVTLTIFRAPGTGIQVSKGHLAAFVGHYPTAYRGDGKVQALQFVRTELSYYLSPHAKNSPYASLSFAKSLTRGWNNSGVADVGVRRLFGERFSGQLGVSVLHAPSTSRTSVSPTGGFGVRF